MDKSVGQFKEIMAGKSEKKKKGKSDDDWEDD